MFKEQVTTEIFVRDIFFLVSAIMVVVAILGFGFVDSGLSRRKNVLDNWIQKIIAGFACAFGFILVGYGIWYWQYNQAFGVENAFSESIKGWWLGGSHLTQYAQFIDPKVVPGADELQIFAVFFFTFAMLIGTLMHSAGLERIKPFPLYVMAFLTGAVSWPFLSYLVWGSVSPLTNRGVHDFIGVFNLYIFVGGISVVMAWRLGPRIGAFASDVRTAGPTAHDWGQAAAGVLLLLFAVPFIVLGSGFLFPGVGYFGIAMTTSGIGIVLLNVFVAYAGGALVGALLAYREKNPTWVLLGPLAGYISGSALMDVVVPWKMFIVALFGPLCAYGTYHLLRRLRIDDPKLGPVFLGAGVYSAVITGFVGWHVKTGGFLGLSGKYGFQHAEITPWWQLVGVGVALAFGVVPTLLMALAFERTTGLRVSEEEELAGMDATYWRVQNYSDADGT